jgi:hypothetical protein
MKPDDSTKVDLTSFQKAANYAYVGAVAGGTVAFTTFLPTRALLRVTAPQTTTLAGGVSGLRAMMQANMARGVVIASAKNSARGTPPVEEAPNRSPKVDAAIHTLGFGVADAIMTNLTQNSVAFGQILPVGVKIKWSPQYLKQLLGTAGTLTTLSCTIKIGGFVYGAQAVADSLKEKGVPNLPANIVAGFVGGAGSGVLTAPFDIAAAMQRTRTTVNGNTFKPLSLHGFFGEYRRTIAGNLAIDTAKAAGKQIAKALPRTVLRSGLAAATAFVVIDALGDNPLGFNKEDSTGNSPKV